MGDFIWSTLGIFRPQSQVLYSASKGVNSSVGLLGFFVSTYKNDLISVGGHKKHTDLQKKMEYFRGFVSHSVLPTKMTYKKLFIFVFLESHSGWLNDPYSRDSSRYPRRRPFNYTAPPSAIGRVPSLSGPAIACRWRSSLPRVRRDRVSSPQGSASNNGCRLFRLHRGRSNVRLSFPTPTIFGMKWL